AAAGHAGRRRQPARSLGAPLRQQHLRRQPAHAPRSPTGRRRRRQRSDQGRTPRAVRAGYAPQQSPHHSARQGRRARGSVRRQRGQPDGHVTVRGAFGTGLVGLLCWVALAPAVRADDSRLLEAVKRRDRQAVASLLRDHADVNAAQPDGATPLAWAVYLGDADAADALLAAGAKVDAANEYGETPLTLACANGDAALVAKLLAAGANANGARWNGETALMIATGAGSLDSVNRLIEHGAAVNAAESRKGQTAVMWAAADGQAAVMRALVAHGADVNIHSKSGATALVLAAARNREAMMRALVEAGARPPAATEHGMLLRAAVSGGKLGTVRYAYELDPHVDVG